jgi:hypothetical protein
MGFVLFDLSLHRFTQFVILIVVEVERDLAGTALDQHIEDVAILERRGTAGAARAFERVDNADEFTESSQWVRLISCFSCLPTNSNS